MCKISFKIINIQWIKIHAHNFEIRLSVILLPNNRYQEQFSRIAGLKDAVGVPHKEYEMISDFINCYMRHGSNLWILSEANDKNKVVWIIQVFANWIIQRE